MYRRVADHLQYRLGIGHGANIRFVCDVIWKLSKIVTHYQENSDPSVFIRKAITLPGTIGTEDTAITSQKLEDEVVGTCSDEKTVSGPAGCFPQKNIHIEDKSVRQLCLTTKQVYRSDSL